MEQNKKTLIQKMHIQLIITILVMNIASLITSIVINNYSYFYGAILGSVGALLYFYTLVFSTHLIVNKNRSRKIRRKLFAFGMTNYIVKISIFALIILIALKINYNFNSGVHKSLWATSLYPINWWICFGTLLLPALNAFMINLPWYNSKNKT